VEVDDVSRILPIDISGTIAATVFGLGLGDDVVGRDASTDLSGTEKLPVVTGSSHTLNAEAILELAPTIVLTDTTIGPKEVRQQLRDAGIAVVVVSSERRADTTGELIMEIATALGVPSRGEALAAQTEADIAAAKKEIAAITPAASSERARMVFLYVRGSANIYYIFGRDSGADSLIDAVGGIDVAAEMGWEGMRPMTAEALVAARPDVLVMMTDGLASVGGIDGLLERVPALQQTAAGQHRRVVDMADSEILSFGPRTAEIIRALARALYAPADSPAPSAAATPAS
jgi:iron complex transport system substrate-binding protein